jgi:AcrR family transcriptional regulator
MDAARRHFLQREFKAVSVREIAESAGVNGAMVNYYFGSKQGLYMAMVDELLSSLEASLAELGGDEALSVTEFSRAYTQVLLENPWWPNFLLREVLMKEGESRNAMVARFAGAFAPRLMASISFKIRDGQYRDDLDPRSHHAIHDRAHGVSLSGKAGHGDCPGPGHERRGGGKVGRTQHRAVPRRCLACGSE